MFERDLPIRESLARRARWERRLYLAIIIALTIILACER